MQERTTVPIDLRNIIGKDVHNIPFSADVLKRLLKEAWATLAQTVIYARTRKYGSHQVKNDDSTRFGSSGYINPEPLPLPATHEHRPTFPVGYFDVHSRTAYPMCISRPEPVRPLICYDNVRPSPAPVSNSSANPLNWSAFGTAIPAPSLPDTNGYCYADSHTSRNFRRTVFDVSGDKGGEGGFLVLIDLVTTGSTRDEVYAVINDNLKAGIPQSKVSDPGAKIFRLQTDNGQPANLMGYYGGIDTDVRNFVLHTTTAIERVHAMVLTYCCIQEEDYNDGIRLGFEKKLDPT